MAVYDSIAVCNMALDRIDIGQPIDDIAGDSDTARACNRWYAKCRDKVLQLGTWPFLKRQIALGLVEEDPVDKWAYSYRYPINCVRVLSIVSGNRIDAQPIEWEMGQDDTGRLIYTDEVDAFVEYLGTLDDPGEWFDLFADAVAYLLAAELSGPLGRGDDARGRNMAMYGTAKAQALAKAQAEGFLKRPASSYITSRGGASDRRDHVSQ